MRLVTRGDFDGLICSVLLTTMEDIERIELVHPQHITDNLFIVKDTDIIAKLPYHSNCNTWFSHRPITESNARPPQHFKGRHAISTSASRVIYEHYNSPELKKFESLVAAADKIESAQLTPDEVENPSEALLLGFLMDPRTSFGAFKVFFKSLVARLREKDLAAVMAEPDVSERADIYHERQSHFKEQLKQCSRVVEHVVVTDFCEQDLIPVGNRFLVYALFPDCNASLRLQWGPDKRFVAATMGRSIFNRSSTVNIGNLCSDYGGGGHEGAGSVPLEPETAQEQIEEIINLLNSGEDC